MQSRALRPEANRRSSPSPMRAAFSLVELVIVILIIAILSSLILSGVQSAMKTARVAAVTVEFKNLEKAITDFKAKYGTNPPSSIVLCESESNWITPVGLPSGVTGADIQRSRALIKQIWPDFEINPSPMSLVNNVDLNEDGDTSDYMVLNGAECLVFFLGGVVDQTGDPTLPWALLGFSTNPQTPFIRGGSRVGPFFEFEPNRLTNVDSAVNGDVFPEFRDNLPGQTNPILYGSSYDGKGYRNADFQLTTQGAYDRYATARTGFAWYYRRYTASMTPPTVAEFNSAEAFNPKSYQLISPGIDGEYGTGGGLNASMEMAETLKNDPFPASWPLYNNSSRSYERDNITNFKGGALN